jgi:hypothetical protein
MLKTTQRSGSAARRGNRSGPEGNRPKKGRVNNIFVNMAEVGDLNDNRDDDFAQPMEGNETNVFVLNLKIHFFLPQLTLRSVRLGRVVELLVVCCCSFHSEHVTGRKPMSF